MTYEYKCVGAPEKARRVKGAKTRTDRVAAAMQKLIQAEAVQGWEYLRTDLVPIEEKASFLARAREVHRAVLVFRRAKPGARQAQSIPTQTIVPTAASQAAEPAPDPSLRIAAERTEPGAPAGAGFAAGEPGER